MQPYGYAVVHFSVLRVLVGGGRLAMYAMSRSQTPGPHLTNWFFRSFSACLPQHQHQHHTTGQRCLQACIFTSH